MNFRMNMCMFNFYVNIRVHITHILYGAGTERGKWSPKNNRRDRKRRCDNDGMFPPNCRVSALVLAYSSRTALLDIIG